MEKRLTTTYILSLLDLMCTMYFENLFGNIEGNPFGAFLMAAPIAVVLYKVYAVGIGLYVLKLARQNKFAVVSSWLLFGVYTSLAVYHLILIGYSHYLLFLW